jgi:uncharacterized protein YcsI (UPF0317 family)
MIDNFEDLSPKEVRARFRTGELVIPTSGLCYGYLQGSMKALPQKYAFDFLLYCQRNPTPEPVLEVLDPGCYLTKILADDADLRTDIPRYRIFEHGEVKKVVTDATDYWRDDLVTFLMGGSITFEGHLINAGIPVRHIEEGVRVPMYITNVMTHPTGPFHGGVVVSMRPIPQEKLIKTIQITSSLPLAHGAPIWAGDPSQIGIADLDKPDFGDPVKINKGEIPVFWACGNTSLVAARNAKVEFMITHDPGIVFISDIREEEVQFLNTPWRVHQMVQNNFS